MEKIKILAQNLIKKSLEVKKDENILINVSSLEPLPLVKELINEIKKVNANVEVRINDYEIDSLIKENLSIKGIILKEKINTFDVNTFDTFINIRCNQNDYEDSKIKRKTIQLLGKYLEKSNDIKINNKKWVLLNYPSKLDSYKAHMKTEDFYDFSLDVMSYNYKKMTRDILPLKELMEKTNMVHIIAKDTDISFSIKDMPIIPCTGEKNIPDGEIYTAPIKDSVNGYISYNTPSFYQGNIFQNIKLNFKNGRIIGATCTNKENEEKLKDIFRTDEGARYIGEFSIGLNPMITEPMGDILFDEKIIGSIHFTPGRAYKDAYNGNDSNIHWDLVLIQRKEYGGGKIFFDNVLIRDDGKFVINNLKHLNK